jgi:hypothetical protein
MTYSRAIRTYIPHVVAVLLILFPLCQLRSAVSPALAGEPTLPPTIVFGFVGGFVKYDDVVHNEVQLAIRLRHEFPAGTIVEIFENHSANSAYKRLLPLLDTNRDGSLSTEEKRDARIILYGHSWGASETVALARRLERDGIPVLLTVQVDSVPKTGENDVVIPANVARAANFYQTEGLLHGESEIRAADKLRTKIIGNFRFSYGDAPYSCTGYPWYARIFMKAHTQIECDPKVWGEVESLIRSSLYGSGETASQH